MTWLVFLLNTSDYSTVYLVGIMALKDVCALIIGTWEYAMLHGKKDFVDVMKFTDHKIEDYLILCR